MLTSTREGREVCGDLCPYQNEREAVQIAVYMPRINSVSRTQVLRVDESGNGSPMWTNPFSARPGA